VKASELYIIVWDIISNLHDWGFTVDFILQDGGEQNREFTKLHFKGNPSQSLHMTTNVCNMTRKLVISQDYSHVVKKVHNSILSSGSGPGNTRHLQVYHDNGYIPIVWQQWIDAVQWDRRTNARLVHHRISDSHLCPTSDEKMRNLLAEDMLDKEMLNLMLCYQSSLVDGRELSGAVELLKNTSQLIEIFHDHRPVQSIGDDRLQVLVSIRVWFINWREHVKGDTVLTAGQRKKMLPSWECLDDLESLLYAFPEVCRIHLKDGPCYAVKPNLYNSDIIENHFCQTRRLHNGNKTHLTYYDYMQTVNSIILTQSSKSRGRKSNTGIPSADPYSFSVPAKKLRI
jgi:hypothetical protein